MEYELDHGELTQIAEDNMWRINSIWNDEDTEICDYIKKPENFSNFHDGLMEFIKKSHIEVESDKNILELVKISAKKKDIPYDDSFRTTMNNWVTGKINPQANEGSKDSLYKLCYILDFSFEETIAFFQKVCLMRPFACRKIEEAIHLFCFSNRKGYNDFVRIKESIKLPNKDDLEGGDLNTSEFITKIEKISDEQELIKIIEDNGSFFDETMSSAVIECKRLFEEAIKKANVKNTKQFVEMILPRTRSGRTFHKSDFLKLVSRDFPSEGTFSKLKNDEQLKYDELRKSIILLEFYLFCKDYKGEEMYEDFRDEINDLLENECGYPPIYSRNPYDCMFLHSVIVAESSEEALCEFQSIVSSMLHLED